MCEVKHVAVRSCRFEGPAGPPVWRAVCGEAPGDGGTAAMPQVGTPRRQCSKWARRGVSDSVWHTAFVLPCIYVCFTPQVSQLGQSPVTERLVAGAGRRGLAPRPRAQACRVKGRHGARSRACCWGVRRVGVLGGGAGAFPSFSSPPPLCASPLPRSRAKGPHPAAPAPRPGCQRPSGAKSQVGSPRPGASCGTTLNPGSVQATGPGPGAGGCPATGYQP